LVEGYGFIGPVILRQGKNALRKRVEQHFIRAARDAACGRIDPAGPPIVFD
jgi:hypothetical protein